VFTGALGETLFLWFWPKEMGVGQEMEWVPAGKGRRKELKWPTGKGK